MKISREFEKISPNRPTSVALGLFDGVHIGHQAVLREALKSGDLTPCVFTYTMMSEVPDNKKNLVHLTTEDQKWKLMEKLGFEMAICPDFSMFKSLEPEEFVEEMLISRMGAKKLVCGCDFTFGKNAKGNVDDLIRLSRPYGVEVKVVSPVLLRGEAVSSTRIREAILRGDMDNASQMLGRRFSICFEVEHGNEIGRLIQFPTINQAFPQNHIIPKYGVYSTVVRVGEQYYGGVTNVGVKPTVGSDRPLSETYILDYSGDLYGKLIEVFFFHLVRNETKFPSVDELKKQISRDTEEVSGDTKANIDSLRPKAGVREGATRSINCHNKHE